MPQPVLGMRGKVEVLIAVQFRWRSSPGCDRRSAGWGWPAADRGLFEAAMMTPTPNRHQHLGTDSSRDLGRRCPQSRGLVEDTRQTIKSAIGCMLPPPRCNASQGPSSQWSPDTIRPVDTTTERLGGCRLSCRLHKRRRIRPEPFCGPSLTAPMQHLRFPILVAAQRPLTPIDESKTAFVWPASKQQPLDHRLAGATCTWPAARLTS